MIDIVERLRAACTDWDGSALPRNSEPMDGFHCAALIDAANEITRLRKELEQALDTLKFYADKANWIGSGWRTARPTMPAGTLERDPSAVEADMGNLARDHLASRGKSDE